MTKRRRILTATLLTVLTVAAVAKVQLEPDPEFHADLENTLEWAYPPSWDDEQKFRELWLHHEKARELAHKLIDEADEEVVFIYRIALERAAEDTAWLVEWEYGQP